MSATGSPASTPSSALLAYSNADNLLAEVATMFATAAIIVLLRSYVRLKMLKSFGHDDWTMLFALSLAGATLICYVLEVPVGLGKHLSVIELDGSKYQQLLKIRYVHQIICGISVTVVKISVALFLLRFVTRKVYRLFLYGLIIFLLAFMLTCAGTLVRSIVEVLNKVLILLELQIWACIPVAASWDFSLRPPPLGQGTAKCFTKDTFGQIALFNAVVNCATDFLLALLPVPLIWQLKLNLRTRLSLILVLSLGVFAGVAGIIRAMVFNTILKDPRRFIHDKYSMWNYVELTVGIVAGSLPALKPLFVRFLNAARDRNKLRSRKIFADGRAQRRSGQSYGDRSRSRISLSFLGSKSRVPEAQMDRSIWSMERDNQSDESVLPLQGKNLPEGGILVTTDFLVT